MQLEPTKNLQNSPFPLHYSSLIMNICLLWLHLYGCAALTLIILDADDDFHLERIFEWNTVAPAG